MKLPPAARDAAAPSLGRQLIAWMLGALVLVWGCFVVWGYLTGVEESEELTDGHLASVATLVLNWNVQGDVASEAATVLQVPPGLKAHDYQESLNVALWNAQGQLISRTGNAPLPAFGLDQGFANLDFGARGEWRSFTQWSRARTAKVTVMVSLSERDSLAGDIAMQMLQPGFWLLPVIAIAVGVAIRRGLKPVNDLADEVARLDPARDQRLSSAHVLRELSPMVYSINTLLDAQQAALARERDLANEVAHELRTPLASIALQAEALSGALPREGAADAGLDELLTRIRQDALHAGHVLTQLLALARAGRTMPHTSPVSVDWVSLARSVAAAQAQPAWQRDDTLAVQAPAVLTVPGNAVLLELALRNLVENAIRHTPRGTRVEIQAGRLPGLAWMQVCDDGARDRSVEVSPPADSLRLGHEIVARVMQAHQGGFAGTRAPEGFTTCYRMEIPLAG